ncbi:MAG: DUF5695 domain-containing protein [Clostridia bacterium]|nr:DUF5695 domain-containing protein [Clostridia bacterium]
MKSFICVILAIIMMLPCEALAAQTMPNADFADIFGWNFEIKTEFLQPSVVSWGNYRGMFLLFEISEDITAEYLASHRVTANIELSLTPNNINQDFTASVFGVDPNAVYDAYRFTSGLSSAYTATEIDAFLTSAVSGKIKVGEISVTAPDTTVSYTVTSKELNLTNYLLQNIGVGYAAFYISNRKEDGCEYYGMAHYDGVKQPTLTLKSTEFDSTIPQTPDITVAGEKKITSAPAWVVNVPYQDTTGEYADFYTKAIYAYNIPICATDDVPDEALYKAYDVIEVYLRKIYYKMPEILDKMEENGAHVIIIGEHEYNVNHPSWKYHDNPTERRGGGGISTTVLVEDLIVPSTDTWRQTFAGLVHEFTHTVLSYGIGDAYYTNGARRDIYEAINAAYEAAAAAGMYPSPNEYDISNYHEYFAGQAGRWFNGSPTDLPVANAANLTDREQLAAYDSDIYEICANLFAPLSLPAPWGDGSNCLGEVTGGENIVLSNSKFNVEIGQYGQISSLKIADDTSAAFCETNYVLNAENAPAQGADTKEHHWFGELFVTAREENGSWVASDTSTSENRRIMAGENAVHVTYAGNENGRGVQNVSLLSSYTLNEGDLTWSISISNPNDKTLEVGDLGLALPFNEYWTPAYANEELYDTRVLAHSFVGGNSSYIYATRPSGQGKFLLMMPDVTTLSGFEYRDTWRANNGHSGSLWAQDSGGWAGGLNVYYIHSNVIKSTGSGYIGNTSLTLEPGESRTYAFKFRSVASEAEMKSTLYDEGIIDAVAVPGMAFPKDMPAKFYLHANADIDIDSVRVECVHDSNLYFGLSNSVNNNLPCEKGQKTLSRAETKTIDGERYYIYELQLSCLGANNVVVDYFYKDEEDTRKTVLQFYLMDSVGTMLDLHSNFLVEKTQIQTPGKTGDKVFDDWMMDSKTTRSAVTGDYWNMSYWGWGDDWGLTHGTFLAQKNIYIPVVKEINALDEYLDTAIWHGLMREHQEDYLIHDFYSTEPNESPTYRGYAYPHIYNTYFAMYRICDQYPDITKYKEAKETYLLRAYNILNALYNGPVAYNWATGLMGEQTTPDIIAALEKEGYYEEATNVSEIMSKKYNNFKNTKYPYGSEYSYDNTGEEAVYTLAKINSNIEMMRKIDLKTRACRGIQPVWYYYATPTTICGESWWNFQYTAALAGYCMDDYLRLWADDKTSSELSDAQRVNYAAKLANLTCINSGQIDADAENIGASAWTYQAFLGHTGGQGTGGGKLHNGWRQMSGESDLGLFGALEILSADVATDNVFGLFGYGCTVEEQGGAYKISPLDGLAMRVNLINEKLSIELERDRYTSASVKKDASDITVRLQNITSEAHETEIKITGLPPALYSLSVDGKKHSVVKSGDVTVFTALVPTAEFCTVQIIKEQTASSASAPSVSIEAPAKAFLSDEIRLVGKSSGADSAVWTTISAPLGANAEFTYPDRLATTVKVNKAGSYTFRLSVGANSLSSYKDVTVEALADLPLPETILSYDFSNANCLDESGNELDAIAYGDIFVNSAAYVNGTAAHGYIRIPGAAADRIEDFTVQAKIKTASDPKDGAALWSFADTAGNGVSVSFLSPGYVLLNVSCNGEQKSATGSLGLRGGAEKTITVTQRGSALELWINKVKCARISDSDFRMGNMSEARQFFIGRSAEDTSIADIYYETFSLLSRALSDNEITSMFQDAEISVQALSDTAAVTVAGTPPVLPSEVLARYSDNTFSPAAVVWDAVLPESYASAGEFIVNGAVGDITVKATVLVIDSNLENIARTAVPTAIVNNASDLGGVAVMNDGITPSSSADTSNGAWHNWSGNQSADAWVMYEWTSEVAIVASEVYYFRDGNGNFIPKSADYEYLNSDGRWIRSAVTDDDGVAVDRFCNTTFVPFATKKIRLNLSPAALGCGIIEWRILGVQPESTTWVSTDTWFARDIGRHAGDTTFNYKLSVSALTDGVVFLCGSNITPSDWGDANIAVRTTTSGMFEARNGDVYTYTNAAEYAVGADYDFKIYVDTSQRRYSVFVTDAAGTTTLLADNFEFRTTSAAVSDISKCVVRAGNAVAAGLFSIRDFNAQSGSVFVEERDSGWAIFSAKNRAMADNIYICAYEMEDKLSSVKRNRMSLKQGASVFIPKTIQSAADKIKVFIFDDNLVPLISPLVI